MARTPAHRIGLIVPSSNVTMETEVPELLRRQPGAAFTFHAARLRLQQVTPEALAAMNEGAGDAVDALADARCDAMAYACLVALMAGGRARIDDTQRRLGQRAGGATRLVTSAGALVSALRALEATRIVMVTPYRHALTLQVVATLAEFGIEVLDARSLEVADNLAVGAMPQERLLEVAATLDRSQAQAMVISACVQMPSLAVVDEAERRFGLPVISAATASVHALLNQLLITPAIAGAGRLLRGGVA